MKIFISWSGEPSRAVALELRNWLPSVIQVVEPWVSVSDIDAGARWSADIASELEATEFGIICLTRSNQKAPWLMFEAGALAKAIKSSRVIPYLIHMDPADVERGPLTEFQPKRANKEETLAMVRTINKFATPSLSETQLEKTFGLWWPQLEERLNTLPEEPTSSKAPRSMEDKVDEMLGLMRGLAQRATGEGLRVSDLASLPARDMYAALTPYLSESSESHERQRLWAFRTLRNHLAHGLPVPEEALIILFGDDWFRRAAERLGSQAQAETKQEDRPRSKSAERGATEEEPTE